MPSFINIRVILAMMMREMTTRYGKSAGGYIWAILEPLGMIALLSVVFEMALRTPALGSVFPMFLASGLLTLNFYQELAGFASTAITMNKPLLTYPRVTPMDAIFARVLLQFTTLSTISALMMSGIIYVYDVKTVYDFISMIKAVLYASLLGVGAGVTNTVIFAFVPTYENVWRIISRPMFFISGVFFIPEELPAAVQDVLYWNPVLHAVGLMRRGFYPTYEAQWVSEPYLFTVGGGLLTVGLFLLYSNRTYIVEKR